MDVKIFVERWARATIPMMSAKHLFEQIDLPDLVPDLPQDVNAKRQIAFDCFAHLVRLVGDRCLELQASLAWPLGYSETLVTQPPKLLPWPDQPPGLSLKNRHGCSMFAAGERYCLTVDPRAYWQQCDADIKGIFECERSMQERSQNFEYFSWLRFRQYPSSLVLPEY